MILDKKVFIKPHINKKYYISKGYDIVKSSDFIEVDVKDLLKGSNIKLNVRCDVCGNEKMLSYAKYNKNISKHNFYSCSAKCAKEKNKITNLERYGYDNPMMSDIVKEEVKKTNIEKYGHEWHTQSDETINKIKESNLEKYGYTNPNKTKEVRDKIKQTNKERYGYETTFLNSDIKEKSKKTILDRYGYDNPMMSDIVKKKYVDTSLERYGYINPMLADSVKEKIIKTNKEKYGYESPLKNDKIREKIISSRKETNIERFNKTLGDNYKIISYDKILKIHHFKCGNDFEIYPSNLTQRANHTKCEICTVCKPIGVCDSDGENKVKDFVKSLDIEIVENDKTVLKPKHLDIYIPSHNLAIEYNGLYWHSELFKDKNYHLDKTIKCTDKDIQLLHIFEDDWKYKQDIVKSIIKNKLGKISNKIYARKCIIKEVGSKDVRQFLDNNHIQGFSPSKYKLGLYYNNELVSLMTFGYRHTNAKKEFELIRFCNLINTNVIGASTKLFKHFINNFIHDSGELISYSDQKLYDGKMYETLGFIKKHTSIPEYYWIVDGIRKHRFSYNKQKLIKEGYDKNMTEVEIMHMRNYYRIYGCGQVKWVYKLS